MFAIKRLRRLESLFESFCQSDEMKLTLLRARRSKLAERQEALLEALSSDAPYMISMMDELASNSVRLAAELEELDGEIILAATSAAPRKAQLERVRQQILFARVEEMRKIEQELISELVSRPLPD